MNISFHLVYSLLFAACGHTGLGGCNQGEIKYPLSGEYTNSEDCGWTIQAPPYKVIY